jgi:signal transduction histidine kinase
MKRLDQTFRSISNTVMQLAREEARRSVFLDKVSHLLLTETRCDAVEILLRENDKYRRCSAGKHQPQEPLEPGSGDGGLTLDDLCRDLLDGALLRSGRRFTPAGSFWTGAADRRVKLRRGENGHERGSCYSLGRYFRSVALVPFDLDGAQGGLLVLKSARPRFFSRRTVELYESVSQLLGVTIVHRRIQLALRERVKELSCLFEISRLVSLTDASLDHIFQSTADLLPPAWLHPEVASARIEFDGRSFKSRGYQEGVASLRAEIIVEGKVRGAVEVSYARKQPELNEGPFLAEERSLIDAIARELALIVVQRSAEQARHQLQEQLRHADRLATIGQLSAGVAHELNEPLGSILGFAQLALKAPQLPDQVQRDLDKIITASLHAREVISKLMLFARQTPPQKNWVDLNILVQDGLYFLESRCAKSGISLIRELDRTVPEIAADPGQLYQVLVNLSVNAIQAMEDGGTLTIRTADMGQFVSLEVEDTGIGLSEEVREQIFLPFFTTKDVGEGTGLGLAVAEGIVTSHGGTIVVRGRPGAGTTFTVRLPKTGAVERPLHGPGGDPAAAKSRADRDG